MNTKNTYQYFRLRKIIKEEIHSLSDFTEGDTVMIINPDLHDYGKRGFIRVIENYMLGIEIDNCDLKKFSKRDVKKLSNQTLNKKGDIFKEPFQNFNF